MKDATLADLSPGVSVTAGYLATCPRGLEELLAAELRAAGIDSAHPCAGGARFDGGLLEAYRACLWSRLASRVLLLLGEVDASDADSLRVGVGEIPWEAHLPEGATLAVDFLGTSQTLRHSLFSARCVKDAVADRLRALRGVRPDVELQDPDVRIVARLERGRASIAIDLSGPAHRRGYRTESGAAPLRENLAAAILLRAGWRKLSARGAALYDPLCGSGTLLIEGAQIASGAAPGETRAIGSPGWSGHDAARVAVLREEARTARETGTRGLGPLVGADHDPRVLRVAEANAARAGFAGRIQFHCAELDAVFRPAELVGCEAGLLVCNPPYGERLDAGATARLRRLYATLGELVCSEFAHWHAAVIVPDNEIGAGLRLGTVKRYSVRNGAIDCVLLLRDPARQSRRPREAEAPQIQPIPAGEASLPAGGAEALDGLSPGARMLANRLRKNLQRLAGWLTTRKPDCYRIYDADIPEYAIAVDRYGGWLHVAEYAPPSSVDASLARARLDEALEALSAVTAVPPSRIALKTRERQRGSAQYRKQAARGEFLSVREGAATLQVNLHDYLDTGLFLDHRPLRRLVASRSAGKRFLNLFCYTGTVSVFAALGGASSTTSVDMSATYLSWAGRNLAMNGFTAPAHDCVQADCLAWLTQPRGSWDLIFLDPPSFSNSARMRGTLDVQRDHVELLRGALRQLAPGGELLFSTNRQGFRLDAGALAELAVEDLTEASIDPDFRRGPVPHRLYRIGRPDQ